MRFKSIVLAGALLAAAAPGAWAHEGEMDAVEEHAEQDSVVHTPQKEQRLERRTDAATRADAAAAAADAAGDPDEVGEWGSLMDWPVVGIHVALMPDGRVVAFDSIGDKPSEQYPDETTPQITRSIVWDPATEEIDTVNADTGVNIFCAGLAHLMNGDLFVAGGNGGATLDGITATNIFDAATNSWRRDAEMAYKRWYPSVTPLQNGDMLITEGYSSQGVNVRTPEVREADGDMRTLPGAETPYPLPLYPWMDVGPNGRVFYTGPDPYLRSLDPSGAGDWDDLGTREPLAVDREYGSHALYDVGKVLVSGGGRPPTATATVVDLRTAPRPTPSPTAPMETPRRQHNLTVLADGTVLATGGLSSNEEHVDLEAGVYTAELWNPLTGQWRTLAAEQETRQYHSTALLLPDGRVLSSGGGICSTCDAVGYLAKNAQVFTPPYLFEGDGSGDLAPRPQITSAPGGVGYDESFEISTPAPGEVEEVAMVRLGSVTHSVNMEQRYVPLEVTEDENSLVATSPGNANTAPPGIYMLFLIDEDGVPSEAAMVQVKLPADGPPDPPDDPDPPDAVPPDTRISKAPAKRIHGNRARFRFSSNEPGSTFQCRLDGRRYRGCSSPRAIKVTRGKHRFSVRAVDGSGNADPTAATMRFRVVRRR